MTVLEKHNETTSFLAPPSVYHCAWLLVVVGVSVNA